MMTTPTKSQCVGMSEETQVYTGQIDTDMNNVALTHSHVDGYFSRSESQSSRRPCALPPLSRSGLSGAAGGGGPEVCEGGRGLKPNPPERDPAVPHHAVRPRASDTLSWQLRHDGRGRLCSKADSFKPVHTRCSPDEFCLRFWPVP